MQGILRSSLTRCSCSKWSVLKKWKQMGQVPPERIPKAVVQFGKKRRKNTETTLCKWVKVDNLETIENVTVAAQERGRWRVPQVVRVAYCSFVKITWTGNVGWTKLVRKGSRWTTTLLPLIYPTKYCIPFGSLWRSADGLRCVDPLCLVKSFGAILDIKAYVIHQGNSMLS